MNKIKEIINLLKSKMSPTVNSIDTKLQTLIPNSKLRKILYISIGSLFALMFLIIILGILVGPTRRVETPDSLILNKPKIETATDAPIQEISETQKKIMDLEMKIKELRFPESTLNVPVIESNISI